MSNARARGREWRVYTGVDILNTIHWLLYTGVDIRNILHSKLYNVYIKHFTLYTENRTLYSIDSALHIFRILEEKQAPLKADPSRSSFITMKNIPVFDQPLYIAVTCERHMTL